MRALLGQLIKRSYPDQTKGRVLVFRTSVETSGEVKALKPVLDRLMGENEKWNFDLEDCDRILRVESHHLASETVIERMKRRGFHCAELE